MLHRSSSRTLLLAVDPLPTRTLMSTIFAKLNLKDHKQIVVLDSPGSFESELAALQGVKIIRDLKKAKQVTFSLAFVTTQEQVDALAPAIVRKAEGDAIVWFAYP